jgi:hypothetical protein
MSAEPRPTPPPATPSQVQPIAPPKPQFTAAQLLVDNLSTRLREFGAFTAISLFVYWKAIPGLVGAAIIAAIVLPIEITRQLAKVGVARFGGGAGAAAMLGVVALHKVLTWGAVGVGGAALVASLAGCPVLPAPDGCTPRDQRCHNGAPEVCSQTQRWTPADRPCGELGAGVVCCATASPYGRQVHACAPQDACTPSLSDGGVE